MRPQNPVGQPFYILDEVDSTNNYAMRLVQAQMAVHGAAYLAMHQHTGKAQRGKVWNSERGMNIMMSCVLEPFFLTVDNQFLLNITVALACFDFFKMYTSDISIKWPNDIYWKDRKAGGILIENLLHGKEWNFAVAGTGLNINQVFFARNLPNPVSLKQITGKTYDIIHLAKSLCKFIDTRWRELTSNLHTKLLEEYSANLYKTGKTVTFKKNDQVFEAVVAGVTKKGELILDTGQLTTHTFGSIEWIIPSV